MIPIDSVVTSGTVLVLGFVVTLWWLTRGRWGELRQDWRDFRKAAGMGRAVRKQREAIAHGQACRRCGTRVNPGRLYRAVRTSRSAPPETRWVCRCPCGELTLYEGPGQSRRLAPASAA